MRRTVARRVESRRGGAEDGTPAWLNGLVHGFVLPPPRLRRTGPGSGAPRSQSWPRENERKRAREEGRLNGLKPQPQSLRPEEEREERDHEEGGGGDSSRPEDEREEGGGGSSEMAVDDDEAAAAAPATLSLEEARRQLAALAGLSTDGAVSSTTLGPRVSPDLEGAGRQLIWWQAQPSIAIKGFRLPSSAGSSF